MTPADHGQLVHDELAILRLMARYNHAVDSGDVAAFLATFTSDGLLRVGDQEYRNPSGLTLVASHGRTRSGQHATSDVVVDIDGGSASARSYCRMFAVDVESGSPVLVSIGTFDDSLVKVQGEWRFVRRLYRRQTSAVPSLQ